MRRFFYSFLVVLGSLLISSTSVYAQYGFCRPVVNCGASDNPCYYREQNSNADYIQVNPLGVGTPVIRVRLCINNNDPMCDAGSGSEPPNSATISQSVSVLAELENGNTRYITTLRSNGEVDTGPVTEIEGLRRLIVRCGIVQTSSSCHWIMQVCRKDLPVKFPLVGAAQLKVDIPIKVPGDKETVKSYKK